MVQLVRPRVPPSTSKQPKTRIEAKDAQGASLGQVELGKKGPDWGSAWTQREGQAEVLLLAEGAVGRLADKAPTAKDWINRQPAKITAAEVASIALSGEIKSSLTRGQAAPDAGAASWSNESNQPVDKAKAEALTTQLSSLYVDDRADAPKSDPVLNINLVSTAQTIATNLHQEDEKSWVLVVNGQGYAISETNAKNLRNKARELVGMGPLD